MQFDEYLKAKKDSLAVDFIKDNFTTEEIALFLVELMKKSEFQGFTYTDFLEFSKKAYNGDGYKEYDPDLDIEAMRC